VVKATRWQREGGLKKKQASDRRALTAGDEPTAKTYEGKTTKNPHTFCGDAGFCFLNHFVFSGLTFLFGFIVFPLNNQVCFSNLVT